MQSGICPPEVVSSMHCMLWHYVACHYVFSASAPGAEAWCSILRRVTAAAECPEGGRLTETGTASERGAAQDMLSAGALLCMH